MIDFLLHIGLSFESDSQKLKIILNNNLEEVLEINISCSPLFYLVMDYPEREELARYVIEEHKANVLAKTYFNCKVLCKL